MKFKTVDGREIDTDSYPFKEGAIMEQIENNNLRTWANANDGMYFIWGALGDTSHATFNFRNQKNIWKLFDYLAGWLFTASKKQVRLFVIDKQFGFWKNLRTFIKAYRQK